MQATVLTGRDPSEQPNGPTIARWATKFQSRPVIDHPFDIATNDDDARSIVVG